MNKRKQGTTTEVAESYTLSRIGEPDGEFKPLYIATVRGVEFAVGQFATVAEAKAAADANLADYVTRIEPRPAYRVEEIGTVTVDTGSIVILDPCRIGRIAATQDQDDLVGSPLYPDDAPSNPEIVWMTTNWLARFSILQCPQRTIRRSLRTMGRPRGTLSAFGPGLETASIP